MNLENELSHAGQVGRLENVPFGPLDVHLEHIVGPFRDVPSDVGRE